MDSNGTFFPGSPVITRTLDLAVPGSSLTETRFKTGVETFLTSKGVRPSQASIGVSAAQEQRFIGGAGEAAGVFSANVRSEIFGQASTAKAFKEVGLVSSKKAASQAFKTTFKGLRDLTSDAEFLDAIDEGALDINGGYNEGALEELEEPKPTPPTSAFKNSPVVKDPTTGLLKIDPNVNLWG